MLKLSPKHRKVYVVVREDLGPVYASVQGGHALADLLLSDKVKEWNNDYLIYLQVKDEEALKNLMYKLDTKGVQYGKFYEPDIEYQATAIAVEGNDKIFKNLSLLEIKT